MKGILRSLFTIFLVAVGVNAKREECGGSRIIDSDTVAFPGTDEVLIPGEVCVWAVHLNTTQGFRINFDLFDIESTAADCSDAGVRIYSLTNLVPSDRIEGYTFCKANPPPATLFLSGSVALIISYTSPDLTLPGTGFSLNWEGNAFNPLQTKHVAAFTPESYGTIKYPAQGQYATNIAATWVISTNGSESDINLKQLGLQTCPNADACTCDALILYEVSERGVFRETTRRCSDATNVAFQDIDRHFVLAFFTDGQSQSLGGTGLNAEFIPSGERPTTTTTEIPGIRCGQVLGGTSGTLRYKAGETYEPNERCVWTLRHTEATSYHLRLISTGITDPNDGLELSSFKRLNTPLVDNRVVRFPGDFEMVGNIVIITFYSDDINAGQGFELEWDAVLFLDDVSNLSEDFILSGEPDFIKYPVEEDEDVNYHNYELSTFLYSPNFMHNSLQRIKTIFQVIQIESCYYDSLSAYKFFGDNTFGEPRWSLETKLCSTNSSYVEMLHNDMMLFVFTTDGSGVYRGFNITFDTVIENQLSHDKY